MPAQPKKCQVTGGVDTHRDTHHAAAIDAVGRLLGDREFPATEIGYQELLSWLRLFGRVVKVGVEGTGSYGAGLARHLRAAKIKVVEIDRPDRKTRRRKGKSDPIDAIAAARAALSGTATGTPKDRTGPVESIRVLRVARAGAVKARTAATNQLHGLIVTAPPTIRAELTALSAKARITRCAELSIDDNRLSDPVEATKTALRAIAQRIRTLDAEIKQLTEALTPIVAATAPRLTALFGVGTDVAGQILTTAGDNPDRLRSESSMAHLCGVAPIPASSGQRANRHRLNRGGDRKANNALYTIALCRMRYDPRTREYVTRRTGQGLSKKEIIRCLKRYIMREVYEALLDDHAALTALDNP
jgi:transposase